MLLVAVGAKRLLSVVSFSVFSNTQQQLTLSVVVDTTVEPGRWKVAGIPRYDVHTGGILPRGSTGIEKYLTIPLDFFPALYSINALVGVAEGVDEGGNMAHFMD